MNHKQQQALKYLSIGFSIVPVPRGQKYPNINWKEYQARKPTIEEVTEWFSDEGNDIAIVTGKVSNLIVLDLDSDENNKLPELPGSVPPTATVKTGGGGQHYYFNYPKHDN